MDAARPAVVSRRTALGLGLGAVTAAALGGCGGGRGAGPAGAGGTLADVPVHIPPPAVDGALVSKLSGVPRGYATLPETLFRSTHLPLRGADPVRVLQIVWGNPPSGMGGNAYWKVLNQGLGATYDGVFVPFDAYDAKVSTTLASGRLPDIMELVPSATSEKAIRQGAFADLTDVLGGDGIKKYRNLAAIRPEQWRASAVDGRILGVPIDLPLFDMVWYYRGDWAAKAGHPDPPRTPEEFKAAMVAIAKSRPGGKQVYGLAGYGGSFGSSNTTFLDAMFRVPNQWRLEKGGKLVNAIDTDEYERSVAFARDLWHAGAFHPDSLALGDQGAKTLDMFLGDQIAFVKGGLAGSLGSPWVDKLLGNPDIEYLVPPGADGKGFAVPRTNGWYGRSVIPAAVAKDKKRLDQVLSVLDYMWSPFGSVELANLWWGRRGDTYDLRHGFPTVRTSGAYADDVIGFAAWTAPFFYQCAHGRAPIERAIGYCETMVRSSVANPVANVFSAANNRLSAQLTTLQQEYVSQIVAGRRPMSDLRTYRKEWHRRGGDQIIAEYKRALDKNG